MLSFCSRAFTRIRFCDLPCLARSLASSKWHDRAIRKNEWMHACRGLYTSIEHHPGLKVMDIDESLSPYYRNSKSPKTFGLNFRAGRTKTTTQGRIKYSLR
ncbi:hypothetical protein BDV19DRAFT_293686 [Aspergillus venezuelensis]